MIANNVHSAQRDSFRPTFYLPSLGLETLFLTIAGDKGELLGVMLTSGAVREWA